MTTSATLWPSSAGQRWTHSFSSASVLDRIRRLMAAATDGLVPAPPGGGAVAAAVTVAGSRGSTARAVSFQSPVMAR